MQGDRLLLGAATSRLVLGVFALTMLPLLYPGLAAHRAIFAAYIAFAALMQLLIWRGVGGRARAIAGGLVDMLILTFIVHRVGSTATMMVSIYFFAAIVNTLVVGRRVGVVLAVASALLYSGVVTADVLGILPYGPDAPAWVRGRPGPTEAAIACLLLSILLVASGLIVGRLVARIRTREDELVSANARLSELSARDALTQLYNRRYLMSRLEDELARVRRGHALAVIMIDLDRFKRINDEQGTSAVTRCSSRSRRRSPAARGRSTCPDATAATSSSCSCGHGPDGRARRRRAPRRGRALSRRGLRRRAAGDGERGPGGGDGAGRAARARPPRRRARVPRQAGRR
ncbi:MAG: diguanylate cyclase [Sandaracinaceae bacterium]|nr:diguanylate cyclase [Sandaracinaceae bacterium]